MYIQINNCSNIINCRFKNEHLNKSVNCILKNISQFDLKIYRIHLQQNCMPEIFYNKNFMRICNCVFRMLI